MTDLLVPPTDDPELPPPPPPPGNSPQRPAAGRGRFLTGIVVGAAVGAAVAAGAVLLTDDEAPPPPAQTSATPSPAAAPNAGGDKSANGIDELAANAERSIVSIHDSIAHTDIFGRRVEGQAAGTGFVFSTDGYIVTNNHVIDGATDITADFSDGKSVSADVVAADPGSDLAVLEVDRTDLVALPLGDSDALRVGDQVVAIGNALDLSGGPTVTTGIVSATGRSLAEPNGEHLANLLQTDTAINPGNSGGPLLDMQGEVIGINTAIAGQAQNIGFAIAIDPAKLIIDELRSGQVPDHALLGVSTEPLLSSRRSGALVVEVQNGSAASDAGLRTGDVITAVDGTEITSPDDLASAVVVHRPGESVRITYRRGSDEHTVTAVLGTLDATTD